MFALGLRVIRSLCEEQSPLRWHHAKLSAKLFKPAEVEVFEWANNHLTKHHVLPTIETLEGKFPEMKTVGVVEPASYYIAHLESQYFYDLINHTNLQSQAILKENPEAHEAAIAVLKAALNDVALQKYRNRILDVGKEGALELLQHYHNKNLDDAIAEFGWPHLDVMGRVRAGEVVSFIGRPAQGKTWKMLHVALYNWRKLRNTLFVSMEMSPIPILERIGAMYAHTNYTQLKTSGYATPLYNKFRSNVLQMNKEGAKFYVVDGNLAASVDDIFTLADQLKCPLVLIDGAYLMRHPNSRLDRYNRAAENVELIKRGSTDLLMATFASWQFSREATKKTKKLEVVGLEDIGYSDAIGQISSVVLGLFQDDGIETMKKRQVRVLKGRSGETGQFEIHWNFVQMDFSQILPPDHDVDHEPEPEQLGYI